MNSALRLLVAGMLAAATAAADAPPPYRVVDGTQVDAQTHAGWGAWRAMACERCHGNQQQGLVGPALTQSLKTMTREEFRTTVLNGRIEKGMPNFGNSETVVRNIDGLYNFLKGRADGAIAPGRLQVLKETDPTDTKLTECPASATSAGSTRC